MTSNRAKRWGFILLLFGLALAIPGVWMLIAPNRYEATTRIKVTPPNFFDDQSYNPYFIQTEFEIIKSDAVLTKVVETLHLDEEWGKRYANGHKLELSDALRLLRQSLRARPVRNTMLVEISFYSEDPAEAANVANAIAQSYFTQRLHDFLQLQTRGHAALKEQLADQGQKIKVLQAQVDTLKQRLNPPKSTTENPDPKYQPYWDAVEKMDAAIKFRDILSKKIDEAGIDPATTEVGEIVSPAVTPATPVSPNRRAGTVLLLSGMLGILCGICLLRRPDGVIQNL